MNTQKDTNKEIQLTSTQISLTDSSYFHNSQAHQFYMSLAERSQKIVTAIYMITDFLDPQDEMRSLLRNNTTAIMKELFEITYTKESLLQEKTSRVLNMLFANISYLDVLYANSFVSQMNYDIVRREMHMVYTDLDSFLQQKPQIQKDKLADKHLSPAHKFVLPKDLFTDEKDNRNIKDILEDSVQKNVAIKDISTGKEIEPKKTAIESPVFVNRDAFVKSLPKKTPQLVAQQKEKKRLQKQNPQSKRREDIIKILEQKKDASINDICDLFKDCSSKTIQRDLAQLIDQGLVKKEGSRRWSTYSLNN